MPAVTLTPTACTHSSGFDNLYYYGNSSSSDLRQLIFTFPNNSELAARGVAITSLTLHYYVKNTNSVSKQLMYCFKSGTSDAPTTWATLEGADVVESKFTAIAGVSKETTKDGSKTYSEGSILIDYLLHEMQAGNPVYLGVLQPTSGYSIQVNPRLSYWKMDVTYEIRGNVPTTDKDSYVLNEDQIEISIERVLSDSTTRLFFTSVESERTLYTIDIGTAESYTYALDADEWGSEFPDAISGSLLIEAATYVGDTKYGVISTTIKLTLPDDASPVFEETSISRIWSDNVADTSRVDAYIQTWSGFKIAYMVGTKYSSTLVSVTLTCENSTYSATNLSEISALTHSAFSGSGEIGYTLTATDSRGYSSNVTGTLTVLPWSAPKIQYFAVNRTTEDGAEAIDGTCAKGTIEASVSSIIAPDTEKNSFSYTIYYREITGNSEAIWSASDAVSVSEISGTISNLLASSGITLDSFNDMAGYEFRVIVSDLYGSSSAYDSLPTKEVYIDVDESTGFMGFGGEAPTEDEGVGFRFYSPIDVPIGSYLERYSTEPTPIGTWIDGRTIYRQVWEVGTVTTTSSGNVTTVLVSGTPTFDALVRLEVYGRWGTSGTNLIQIPRIWTTTNGTLSVDYNANTIRLRSINQGVFTLSNVVVIAEYVVSETTASLDWGDDTDINTDPDDTDAIADLEAKVTSLQAQINELKKEG